MRVIPSGCTSSVTGNFSPISMTQKISSWESLNYRRSLLDSQKPPSQTLGCNHERTRVK